MISPRGREEILGITTGCLLERSSSSMKLSACFDLQGGPYEITKFLPSRGRKKLTVFSPAVVSGPPPTPGAGGIPVFVPSSCFAKSKILINFPSPLRGSKSLSKF